MNAADDEEIVFAPEQAAQPDDLACEPARWKLLVADDDHEVRAVTRAILRDLRFEGRGVELLEAATGAEAIRVIAANRDVAVLLLDVVMESDQAGLDVVKAIRGRLDNRLVRIILRTGQPGHAPERSVIVDYDINDYKEKTELTSQKLVTAVIAGFRSYRDLRAIEQCRCGLEKIVEATRRLFEPQTPTQLAAGVLEQLSLLLNPPGDGDAATGAGLAAAGEGGTPTAALRVIAGSGRFAGQVGRALGEALAEARGESRGESRVDSPVESLAESPVIAAVDDALRRLGQLPPHAGVIDHHRYLGRFPASSGAENVVYVENGAGSPKTESRLLDLFSTNVGLAFDNAYLHEELAATQNELSCTLSQLVETRSHETGKHVMRVGELSALLGELAGLDRRECETLRLSAPMHDIGKIGIPDAILNKPGPLSTAERMVMREHARIGHGVLAGSHRPALRVAAIIALQHHERWDGSGYPMGLSGEQIDPHGRIVGLIDVFDALSHPRCYKQPWPLERIAAFVHQQREKHFDPSLVALFLRHFEKFREVWQRHRDPFPEPAFVDPGEL